MSLTPSAARAGRAWRVHLAWGGAMVAVLAIGVAGRVGPWFSPVDPAVTHVALPLPPMTDLQTAPVAMSPSGRQLAIASASGILFRELSDPEPRLLSGTNAATTPFFSNEGTWIGFHANGRLRKVALDGSEPITVADVTGTHRGFSAMDDGGVAVGHTNAPVSRIPPGGGAPEAMTTLDAAGGETSHRWPYVIPGKQVILFAAGPSVTANEWNTAHIVAQSLTTGTRRVIAQRGSSPRYAAGYVYYLAGRSLLAQRFDPATLQASGPVITLLTDAVRAVNGAGWYAVGGDGALAVVRRPPPAPRKLMWFDRRGGSKPLPLPAAFFSNARLSPNGTRVAVTVSDPDTDVWVYDVTRGTGTRITSDGKSLWPMWTRDGSSVVFSSMRGGPALLRTRLANAAGEDALLLENAFINRAGDWTPGGELLLMQVRSNAGLYLWRPGSEPRLFTAPGRDGSDPRLSPDGARVAYSSTETGRSEIFVSRFPDANGERIQVSRNGASAARWSNDGRELFFRAGPEVWTARLMAGGNFSEPVRLFGSAFLINDLIEVAADGRFLMVVDDHPPPMPTELQLTFNIAADLRRRAASR